MRSELDEFLNFNERAVLSDKGKGAKDDAHAGAEAARCVAILVTNPRLFEPERRRHDTLFRYRELEQTAKARA